MPEVYVDAIPKGESEVRVRVLLNSGARNAQLILPKRVAKRVGLVVKGGQGLPRQGDEGGAGIPGGHGPKTLKRVRNALGSSRLWSSPTGCWTARCSG